MTARVAIIGAALLMAAAVALGAFGAHALKARTPVELLAVWQTAVSYQAWHALGLLATGLAMVHVRAAAPLRYAAWLFVAGIVLFCGSLYALALGAPAGIGIATPFGGVAFIAGWLFLAFGVARQLPN